MPSVALTTLGCKVNQFETEIMEGLFKKAGYEIVDFEQTADVYVINTCSVTHLGEKKSRQLIRRAGRLNPQAVIAVTGCYSQIAPDQIKAVEGVRVIVGTKGRGKIVELVEQAAHEPDKVISELTDIMKADEFEDIPLFDTPGRTRAFLKIQEGCNNFCTYCIIPYARGPLRSRKIASVREEAAKLVKAGFHEIVLTGIHLGKYGDDLADDITLADAVKEVLAIKELKRLRLGSLESIELSDELFELLKADPRFCAHLHLPLQAGSDSVLKAMNRHYNTAEFSALLDKVHAAVPDIAVSTDIIVGFPGESDSDFAAGLEFARKAGFAKIHVFPYSKREGTPAAEYAGQVPENIKKERAHRMQQMADEQAQLYHERFIGRELDVLFETERDGVIDGLTVNYIRVYCEGGRELCDNIVPVKILKLHRDGVWGEICKKK